MSEERKPADIYFKELLEKEGLVISVGIQKVQSRDTGMWMDQPVLMVDYKEPVQN